MLQKIFDFFIGLTIGILLTVSIFLFFGSRKTDYAGLYKQAESIIAKYKTDLETSRKLVTQYEARIKELERIKSELDTRIGQLEKITSTISDTNTNAIIELDRAIEYNQRIRKLLEKGSIKE